MRAIDADNLKQQYGMKDDCSDCEKETKGKVKSCEYDRVYTLMDFCGWIDDMPTIETQQTCEYWDSESKFCALCRPSAQPFHNTTMNEVLKYIDDITEDEWQEFTACLECRGWELKRRTAKWCGGDFA